MIPICLPRTSVADIVWEGVTVPKGTTFYMVSWCAISFLRLPRRCCISYYTALCSAFLSTWVFTICYAPSKKLTYPLQQSRTPTQPTMTQSISTTHTHSYLRDTYHPLLTQELAHHTVSFYPRAHTQFHPTYPILLQSTKHLHNPQLKPNPTNRCIRRRQPNVRRLSPSEPRVIRSLHTCCPSNAPRTSAKSIRQTNHGCTQV